MYIYNDTPFETIEEVIAELLPTKAMDVFIRETYAIGEAGWLLYNRDENGSCKLKSWISSFYQRTIASIEELKPNTKIFLWDEPILKK